jgi:hypothetical protein
LIPKFASEVPQVLANFGIGTLACRVALATSDPPRAVSKQLFTLSRLWIGPGAPLDETVSEADMKRIQDALRHVLGVAGNEE